MKILPVLLIAVAVLLAHTPSAHSELLGTTRVTDAWSASHAQNHEIFPYLRYRSPSPALFEGFRLTSSSVGAVLVATAGSDTGFAEIADRLTDGVKEELCLGTDLDDFRVLQCATEQRLFGLEGNDFGDARVDTLTLTVDELRFEDDVRGGVIIHYTYTLRVYGEKDPIEIVATTWGRIKGRYR